jgi:hypothetical protein
MHCFLLVVGSLVVGAGLGFGFRGWVRKQISSVTSKL